MARQLQHSLQAYQLNEENDMAWETPSFDDIRFGFEVTMYINNR